MGAEGECGLTTWLYSIGSLLIGFWLWVQEVALLSEDSIRVVYSSCEPEVLHLPLPSAGPAPATAPSPFDPPALPIQFEYQQAQLEAEIENLSWKVERADSYDRGVSAVLLDPLAGKGGLVW